MKRTLSLLMAVLMLTAVVLTGCTSGGTTSGAASSSDASSASSEAESESSAAEENDLLAQIKEKGTITVAMKGTWAPWTYHDTDDNLVGYDVEVAQNIAEKLGVEVNFVEGEWDGEVLPKSWTKVMRQSHFEFCIGQDLTHSIFL